MTEESRALMRSAVRKLGPERCHSALAAFDGKSGHSWSDCALGRAYGAPGELFDTAWKAALADPDSAMDRLPAEIARLLGLTPAEVGEVSIAHYLAESAAYAELRDMFEAEAAKCCVRPVAAGV